MRNIFVQEILQEWKEDSGVTHLMLYKLRDGVLTVYTDRPGPLIGKGGERIHRFQEKLKAIPFGRVSEVKLQETDGIF